MEFGETFYLNRYKKAFLILGDIGEVGKYISHFNYNLEYLYLYNNQLTGSIERFFSESFGSLTYLRDLSFNSK